MNSHHHVCVFAAFNRFIQINGFAKDGEEMSVVLHGTEN